ncbi:MAG: dihydropteroate synthase [Kiritimatiellae bacterium]|nr:dihydropteroate synthase [Kiritimatiellia bacterium]
MSSKNFIVIGEKIHCSRSVRVGGSRVRTTNGRCAILYSRHGEPRELPVPPELAAGRLRPCAVAIALALRARGEPAELAADYLRAIAEEQERHGAAFLDINVDEYSADPAECCEAMRWTVGIVQEASRRPVSVDSSHVAVLRAGLEVSDRSRGRPLLNCVSLERPETFSLATEYDAEAVVSAAGAGALPIEAGERVENLARALELLRAAGRPDETLYLDPLVMPVATDGRHGLRVLNAIAIARGRFGPAVHITVGVSNVSYGLPARHLLNEVFAHLARDAGADSAIADPAQISAERLDRLDPTAEPFRLARAVLMNEDEFATAFLDAVLAGRL